jgi:CO dehydrogenase maturation factor
MTTIPMAVSHQGAGKGRKIRVVITGKGGVGKTTLTALLAHCFGEQGYHVLAVDGDPQKNLAATLGLPEAEAADIVPLSERGDYIAEKTGITSKSRGLMVLNPDTADVIERTGVIVGDHIRLLVMGGVKNAGSGCLCPEYTLISSVLRNVRFLPDNVVLLDTPAGLEHFGRAVAEGFDLALIVTDSSHNAVTVAHDLARLARQSGIRDQVLVVNQVREGSSLQKVRSRSAGVFQRIFALPHDPCVPRYEPSVLPMIGSECRVVEAVRQLCGMIVKDNLVA